MTGLAALGNPARQGRVQAAVDWLGEQVAPHPDADVADLSRKRVGWRRATRPSYVLGRNRALTPPCPIPSTPRGSRRAVKGSAVWIPAVSKQLVEGGGGQLDCYHRGRCRPMLGFKSVLSARRYCRARELLPLSICRMCQHAPDAARRFSQQPSSSVSCKLLER